MLESMMELILKWDKECHRFVGPDGRFHRPETMDSVTTDFVLRILFGNVYAAGTSSSISWQQIKSIPFAEWSDEHRVDYAKSLLKLYNQVHDDHCVREIFSSRSADNCKYFITNYSLYHSV